MKAYLEQLGHAEKSITRTLQELEHFKLWCKQNNQDMENMVYKDIMGYISYLQNKQGVKQITIAKYLSTLKHYYQFLITENQRNDNPIRNISIKGVKRKTYHTTFDEPELEELYLSYDTNTPQEKKDILLARKRNKAMLGLFVFQGLDSSTIKKLHPKHIDLRKGIIYVPYTRKSKERELKLNSLQMMDLMEYITSTRIELIGITEKYTDDLFLSLGKRNDLQNVLAKLSKQLKKQNPKFTGFNQIRASRITRWIQTENLRIAQYRAGHKYISSTENYKVHDIESLALAVEKFMPKIR